MRSSSTMPLQGVVRARGPVLAPDRQLLLLVPLPILVPEALRGLIDLVVSMMCACGFSPCTQWLGDVGDHATVHKGDLRVSAHERAAVNSGRSSRGIATRDLAGDLRILPALGRFDRVPQPRAVLRAVGRLSRGQDHPGPVEVIALAIVMLLARVLIGQALT